MNVGAAEVDITPDFPVDLSGFALREQPSVGVLEPIYARALYLDDGEEKLLWLACDLVALERAFVDEFRAWAQAELNLPPPQVLISATHTHNAPATIHLNACGQFNQRYVALLQAKLRDVARAATGRSDPCDVLAGSATLDLAVDRRKKPSAHVDPHVWSVGFRRTSDGTFAAAVVNYTMHPVTLGHRERRISPDWCGATSAHVNSALAGRPVTLVSNGAAGNINPPAMDQPPDVVRGYGEIVGEAAVRALAPAQPQAARLRVRSITVPVPLESCSPDDVDRIADAFFASGHRVYVWEPQFREAVATWRTSMKQQLAAGGGREVPIEMQAIRIGGVTIVTVNGEMFTRFTDLIRRGTSENLFVVAYANAAFGYIPTREAYAEGGYEVETAHIFYNSFRPRVGGLELLAGRAVELVNSL
jgi:hypothetical protein